MRAALNFAITNSLGAFFVLAGIALLYGRTGALNLAQIGRQLAPTARYRLVVVAFTVIVVGFLIKAAVVPFHFWLLDTASSAPLPLAIVLAGVLDTLGLYAVARVYWTVFAPVFAGRDATVQAILMTIGVLTASAAAILSLAARQPRRRLAFVMVSHTGIQLIAIGCLSAHGLAGWTIYAVADGAVKAALFAAVPLLDPGSQTAKEGIRVSGVAVALVATGGLAVAGLPLFGTALGKGIIEDAARGSGYGWVIPLVVVASALTGAAVLLIALAAVDEGRGRTGLGEEVVAVSAALLAIGVAAGFALTGWAMAVATRFVNTASYQHVVLDSGLQSTVRSAGSVGLTAGGLGLDLLGVAGALTLALSLRRAQRQEGETWSEASRLAAVSGVLWRLHNGSIGDSAAWVTVGVAGVGMVLALGLH